MTVQERLASYVHTTNFNAFTPEVVQDAKKLLLDYLGVTFAGKNAEGCRSVIELVKEIGGKGNSTVRSLA